MRLGSVAPSLGFVDAGAHSRWRAVASRRDLPGWGALAFAMVAIGLSAVAGIRVVSGDVDAGIDTAVGGPPIIDAVLPGSPAWRQGARAGDLIVGRADASPQAWVMFTTGGSVGMPGMLLDLRDTAPLAVAAAALACLSAVALVMAPPFSAGVAAIAIALSERTMMASGGVVWSTVGAVAAMMAPALWLAIAAPRRRASLLLAFVATAGVAVAWVGARLVFPDTFGPVEVARVGVTYAFALAVTIIVIGGAVRTAHGGYDTLRLSDVLFIAGLACAVGVGLASGAAIDVLIVIVLVPLLVYPGIRHGVRSGLDRLILGDLRARASVEGAERERERLARGIHDEPLQRLAAVLQHLDSRDDLVAEAAMLRTVSQQLRDVSVELHPPVLIDLGLGPALRDLVEGTTSAPGTAIDLRLDDQTEDAEARPPAAVELAVYRVAQEALANAVRHSLARTVCLTASIRPDAVELEVRDDGVGFDSEDVRRAGRRGHMGLRSVEERAHLIGARLRIEPARPGTKVMITWAA